MENNLKSIVSNLDSELGAISLKVEELETIKTNLNSVMDKLEDIDPIDAARNNIIIHDVYPTLLMVESLLNYSVKDLSIDYKKTNKLTNELFKEVFQDNKRSK